MDANVIFLIIIVIFLIVLLLYYQKTRFDRLQNKRNKLTKEITDLKTQLKILSAEKERCERDRELWSNMGRRMRNFRREITEDYNYREVRRYEGKGYRTEDEENRR